MTAVSPVAAEEGVRMPLALAVGRRRERHVVDVAPDATVADLAASLGRDPSEQLWIDGMRRQPSQRLIDVEILAGSTVDWQPPAAPIERPVEPGMGAAMRLQCVAGPAAGASLALTPGRHVVGRAHTADLRLADPAIEPHELLVDVADDGSATVFHVTGRVPATVDAVPIHGAVALAAGQSIELGTSRLELLVDDPGTTPGDADRRPPSARGVASPHSPWRLQWLRAERVIEHWHADPLVAPNVDQPIAPRRPEANSQVRTAWARCLQRVAPARKPHRDAWREFESALAEQRAAWTAHHRRTLTSPAIAIDSALSRADPLWARRSHDGDAFRVALGWGPLDWQPSTVGLDGDDGWGSRQHATVEGPLPVDLGPGRSLAIAGDVGDARAVARSLVVQLAVAAGPADWRLVVVSDHTEPWDWCRWLPHFAALCQPGDLAAHSPRAFAGPNDDRLVLVLTDHAELLTSPTGRRHPLDGDGPCAVVAVTGQSPVPADVGATLELGSRFRGRWTSDRVERMAPRQVHATGVAEQAAPSVALALAPLDDPECPDAGVASLPTRVPLLALLDAPSPGPSDERAGLSVPVGHARHPVRIELGGDGPHLLVAGADDAGVHDFLRTFVASLTSSHPSDRLSMAFVSSRRSRFGGFASLAQTVGAIADVDEAGGRRVLHGLQTELRRRERSARGDGTEARLVIVVDDADGLAHDAPGLLAGIVSVARRGGSHGVHLVATTRQPADPQLSDLHALTAQRIALRLDDAVDAAAAVGHGTPIYFDRESPGSALLLRADGTRELFRTADAPPHWPRSEGRHGRATRQPLWLEPLPTVLAHGRLVEHGSVGLVEMPDEQRFAALRWTAREGSLALIGDPGSGTTSTLVTVVAAACADRRLDEVHCYVIADDTSPTAELGALPHVGDVLAADDSAQIERLGAMLVEEIARRTEVHPGEVMSFPQILLAIDGAVEMPGLATIAADGPPVGVNAVVATTSTRQRASIVAGCRQRWLFHLADPADATLVGARTGDVPPPVPGRCCDLAVRRFAQVVEPEPVTPPTARPEGDPPPSVSTLV